MTPFAIGPTVCLLMLSACATEKHVHAVKLSPIEQKVVRQTVCIGDDPFYISSITTSKALTGRSDAINRFLKDSISPHLDGEKSEIYTHDLYYLFFTLGDIRFSQELAQQPKIVQITIGKRLDWIFKYWKLSYPDTELILKKANAG